jgi:hypothetical protein
MLQRTCALIRFRIPVAWNSHGLYMLKRYAEALPPLRECASAFHSLQQ